MQRQPIDYAVAKAGVTGLTIDLAGHLGPKGTANFDTILVHFGPFLTLFQFHRTPPRTRRDLQWYMLVLIGY